MEKIKEDMLEVLRETKTRSCILEMWARHLKTYKPLTGPAKVWGEVVVVAKEILNEQK
jgi:hypothetical protein